MNIEAIGALGAHDEVPGGLPPSHTAPGSATVSFGKLVADGLQSVDQQLKASQADLQRLALGEAGSLHEVMIRLEESRMAFQLMLQARTRVLEAYQEVMRMQV